MGGRSSDNLKYVVRNTSVQNFQEAVYTYTDVVGDRKSSSLINASFHFPNINFLPKQELFLAQLGAAHRWSGAETEEKSKRLENPSCHFSE